jgi:uncharacterized protein
MSLQGFPIPGVPGMLLPMFTVNDEAVGPHQPGRAAPDEPFTTHVLNLLHLLLPADEEFFVDVFKTRLPLIKDDQLRLDVQGFIGQEATHSQTHSGVLDYFAANGVDLTPFTDQPSPST